MSLHEDAIQARASAPFRNVRRRLPGLPELPTRHFHDADDHWYSYKYTALLEAVNEVSLTGDYVQFGVYTGRCARFLAPHVPVGSTLYLLDSFEGLPEDWVGPWRKGHFALRPEDRPVFDSPNIEVIAGWFSETVPQLVERLHAPLAMIHLDADLYSSTRDALDGLNARIVPGTILLFDEYFMHTGATFQDDEHRALLDWCRDHDRDFEYLWKSAWVQVAVRVTR